MERAVLCFGEALIDFHGEGRDENGFARHFVPFAGGAPANVAVAVARLGGTARFAGMLGADRFGDFLLAHLRDAGVGTDDVVRTAEANTALAFVSLDAAGERSFSFYRPPAADLLFRRQHLRRQAFEGVRVLHVCSNSLTEPEIAEVTLEVIQRAHRGRARVSFDLNLRPALWSAGRDPLDHVWPVLHQADVVKLSAEELAWLAVDGEEATLDRLWRGRTRLLVVTDGPHAMRWFHPDAEGELPAYAIDTVDSTGAGDAFVGGLLCRLAELDGGPEAIDQLVGKRPNLHEVLRYSAACGALCASRRGSFTAMPTDAETRAFMEAHA
ncbi:MAG: carbohydrate kinase [Xanthomonadaceae bacterium]|nr:carbohydrate kinase [Xanthomonadaceae bacterium]MDE1962459.1 carbohydrate kinase [Xanthomonadaceae bacterium]